MNTPSVAPSTASPWHAGELALQMQAGVVARMEVVGRQFLRPFLLDQHREFFPLLPFVVLGSVDAHGDAWATLRAGAPGFLSAPDPLSLHVQAGRDASDPADAGMEDGDAVGLLGIDLMTRRRNRLNGTLRRDGDDAFDIEVGQSFGNCPRYIHHRDLGFVRDPAAPGRAPASVLTALDTAARALVSQADTLFVASYVDNVEGGTRAVDVSHRGGTPGFVRIETDGSLTVPDFPGNQFFMTLGNLLANPKAGLVFIDWTTGESLQMTGDARLIVDSPEIASLPGAERLWNFVPRRIVRRPDALPLRRLAANGA